MLKDDNTETFRRQSKSLLKQMARCASMQADRVARQRPMIDDDLLFEQAARYCAEIGAMLQYATFDPNPSARHELIIDRAYMIEQLSTLCLVLSDIVASAAPAVPATDVESDAIRLMFCKIGESSFWESNMSAIEHEFGIETNQ